MRFRITQTTTIEYNVIPENYADNDLEFKELTPQKMLDIDLENFREGPALIHAVVDPEDEKIELVGEILDAATAEVPS